MEGVCTMWLSELGTFAMFWGLKNPSITETDILWYDLRDYVSCSWCNACIFSPFVPWPCFTLHYELVTMHAPWLSHCKSSWSCMNWKLGSKHLDVMHGVVPHAATICSTTKWSEGPPLRDRRYVNKLSNLLSLTECGFYDHLEEDGLFYLNMDM